MRDANGPYLLVGNQVNLVRTDITRSARTPSTQRHRTRIVNQDFLTFIKFHYKWSKRPLSDICLHGCFKRFGVHDRSLHLRGCNFFLKPVPEMPSGSARQTWKMVVRRSQHLMASHVQVPDGGIPIFRNTRRVRSSKPMTANCRPTITTSHVRTSTCPPSLKQRRWNKRL